MPKLSDRLSLFEPQVEKVSLFLPVFFLLLVPIEFLFFKDGVSGFTVSSKEILLNAIFLNVTHVSLTYIMLLYFPEMRTWQFKNSKSPSRFWLGCTAMFIILFLLVLTQRMKITDNVFFAYFSGLLALLPFHHALFQVRGLSACYSQQLPKNKTSELLERFSFYLIFTGFVFTNILREYFLFDYNILRNVFMGMYLLAFVGISVALSLIPKIETSNKGFFLVRLVLLPLSAFSGVAAAAGAMLHGVEYFCVFHKMNSRSNVVSKQRILAAAFTTLVVFGILYSFLRIQKQYFDDQSAALPLWLLVINSLITALTLLHYYLDRNMFRMRNPATRETIGPLLL